MVSGDEKDVTMLFARFVDMANSSVGLGYTLNSSLVYTCMANHIWRRKVVHDKFEFVLSNTLNNLLSNSPRTHLGFQIISSDSGRGDHIPLFTGELFLNTSVEKECDVCVFFGFGNVTLLYILLAKPFGEDVAHVLRRERNGEGVVGLVLGHGSDVNVLRVGEVGPGRAVVVSKKLSNFTNTV